MSKPKKGAIHQVLVPLVDATDFASIESAITESEFNSGATVKFFGVDTGTSDAATSGAVSKLASLVRSGVFRITLKATENAYDQMMLRVTKSGCAEQIITWENVDNDDSDLMSMLAAISAVASDAHSAAAQANSRALLVLSNVSDVQSALTVVQSMASDAASAAQQGSSRALLLVSSVSDLQSALSNAHSDLRSQISGITVQLSASDISDIASAVAAAVTTITASDISDIASRVDAVLASRLSDILSAAQQTNSRVLVIQSIVSDVRSQVSDLQIDFQSRVPKLVATSSQLSDLSSDLKSAIGNVSVALTASDISDIASAVAATAGALTASEISDIASAVRALLVSDLSDLLSRTTQLNSRVLVAQSLASDAHSAATVAASRALVTQDGVSDVYSLLSDLESNLGSRIPKRVATDSQLSALVSDLASAIGAGVPLDGSTMSDLRSAIEAGGGASVLSGVLSAAQQANSRLLVQQSRVSDIYSLLSDLHSDVGALSGVVSDIQSAIAAGVEIGSSSLSDLRSAITANGVQRQGAEPTGVVGHTGTLAEKVDWLTALSRNKITQTAGVQTLRNDADTDTIASAVVSDDGTTFTRGEFS